MKLKLTLKELTDIIFQLPAPDVLASVGVIESRAQTVAMMRLAETGLQEWDEAGEDLDDADA